VKQLLTQAIILSRTDYGEADRIITLLTPDYGKISLLAKGVRKIKSKLAGGIELFSVSQITFIQGRGAIGRLVSTRLEKHYGHIIQDIDRVQLGYELIKLLHKTTEDNPESEYFDLLWQTFEALDDQKINLLLIKVWFEAQLLKLSGQRPNLKTDTKGQALNIQQKYDFIVSSMMFDAQAGGSFGANSIKFLRILFGSTKPKLLSQISDLEQMLAICDPLMGTMLNSYVRV